MQLAAVGKQLDKYLSKGWIRPRTSPYGAPILFDRNKDGTLKIYLDCGALNQQTNPNKYPLLSIDNLLDNLVNSHYLSSIDLHPGCH